MLVKHQLRICLVVSFVCLWQTFLCYGRQASVLSADLMHDRERLKRLVFCNQLIAHSPKNAMYYLLRSYSEPFDERSRADIIKAVELNNQIAEGRYLNASIGRIHSDPAFSIRELTAALKISPNYFDANFDLGRCLIGTDNSKAVQYLSRAISLCPNDNTLYSYRSSAYYYMGDVQHAYFDYERAISGEIRTDNSDAMNWTQAYLDDMSSYSQVHPNALASDHQSASVLMTLAKEIHGPNFSHETLLHVIERLSECIERDPSDSEIRFVRAKAFYMDRQLNKALSDLDYLVKQGDQAIPTYWLRAQILMELASYSSALRDLNRCIEVTPDIAHYYLSRARCYFWLGARQKYQNDVLNSYLRGDLSLNEIRKKAKASQCFRAETWLFDPTDRF